MLWIFTFCAIIFFNRFIPILMGGFKMYKVNREKIDEILLYMENILNDIQPIINTSWEEIKQDKIKGLAFERAMHIIIESIVDVGNYIIDGFIMRDPGSYIDIIQILEDEQVIPSENAKSLKRIIDFRKSLVHNYTEINSEELFYLFKNESTSLFEYGYKVRQYLEKELD